MDHTILIIDPDAEIYRDYLIRNGVKVQIRTAMGAEQASSYLPEATILVALAPNVNAELVNALPRLKWIQALTTGVDSITSIGSLSSDVTVTAVRGIHGPQMSELAILQMLSLARNYPAMLSNQAEHLWKRWKQPLLSGKTAGILGVGEIGRALALRLKAFGMHVTGISSAAVRNEPHFDKMVTRATLTETVKELDYLIILVPYSPETEAIVNENVLRAMRPSAFVINLARGGVLDEAALVKALEERWIAGAALDVFREEPLPPTSRLWELPNLLITPHIGGNSDEYALQAAPTLLHNVSLFLSNAPPDALMNYVHRS